MCGAWYPGSLKISQADYLHGGFDKTSPTARRRKRSVKNFLSRADRIQWVSTNLWIKAPKRSFPLFTGAQWIQNELFLWGWLCLRDGSRTKQPTKGGSKGGVVTRWRHKERINLYMAECRQEPSPAVFNGDALTGGQTIFNRVQFFQAHKATPLFLPELCQ